VNVIDVDEQVFGYFQFLDGEATDRWQQFRNEDSVIISEPWAYRRQVRTGDEITLPTSAKAGGGDQGFRVAGIFRDYSSDQGIVTIHARTWDRHWPASSPPSMGIYLDPNTDAASVKASLDEELLKATGLSSRDNRNLKQFSLEIFDRSFAITKVLRVLTIVIAFVGILGALMAIQLERHHEFAVLRATGLTPGNLRGLLLVEGGLMGLAAGLLAAPLGAALSWLLIFIINRRSFGWSMDFVVEPGYLLGALLLGLVAGLAASIYPAWHMSRTSPAAALRYE
jgi:putative ABC transport system permease protein